jgi:multisubunit Na+/H+ antiporter MnhE subunit
MLATIVDWQTLGEVALASLVAGVGVAVAFSLALVGATRMAEMRRDGRALEAGAYAALMILALAGSAAAVAFGVIIMTTK